MKKLDKILMSGLALFVAVFVLGGCGGGGAGAKGNELQVNASPRAEAVKQNATACYWFNAVAGKTYFMEARDQAGNSDTFIKKNDSGVSDSNYHYVDWDSDGVIRADCDRSEKWYLAVKDQNNAGGTSFTVRVATNDESIGPLADSRRIGINGTAANSSISQNQITRFYFDVQIGSSYYIQTRDIRGNSNTFLSSENPLVDDSSYSNVDWDSDDNFRITPSRTGRYYLAVQDNNNVGGTDFAVRVAIENDNVPLAPDFTEVSVDGVIVNYEVKENDINRYYFKTVVGATYKIIVRDSYGNTNTYSSGSNPLVSENGYNGVDWDSDDYLYITADRTGRAYFSVVDQNNVGGSIIAVSVSRS